MLLSTFSKNPLIGSKKIIFLFAIFIGFNSYSQQISIGFPTDGIESSTPTNALFKIYLENGDVNSTGAPITGNFTYTGTASPNVDYVGAFSFSIPPGEDSVVVTIPIIDDALIECDETLIATIFGVNVGTIGTASSTANIIDDECNLGTDEHNSNDTKIEFYPNPAHSTLSVTSKEPIKSFTIIDLNGRIMDAGNAKGQELELNIDDLTSGFYLVTIVLNDGTSVSKKIQKL